MRPLGRSPVDIVVRDGRIASVGERPGAAWQGKTVDGQRGLLLPGLIDGHAHVDKTLWGEPWRPHSAGAGLESLIANEREHRRELPPVAVRAVRLLEAYVANGTTHVRTHVDVDPDIGLTGIEGVLDARRQLAGRLDVQVVAFPQSGLLRRPGTAELLDHAIEAGADLVGGLDPAGLDGEPVRHLDTVFGIAASRGCGLDIHLHDGGELGRSQVELILERTRALGLAGHVTISHAFCLADGPEATIAPLLERLAAERISLATVAPGNRPPLPLLLLRELGIDICLGQDGIRDLWSPYGDADMLERVHLLAWRLGLRRDDELETALETATYGGARVLGIQNYGLEAGCAADFCLVRADSLAETVVARPARTLIVKAGAVIGGTT